MAIEPELFSMAIEPLALIPTETIGLDADLILAITVLKKKLGFPTDFKHVYGHQDEGIRKNEQREKKEDDDRNPEETR